VINVLCHLPYLQNVILCHTSNQKVFLFIPWEVGDLAGVSPMYEKQFWGPVLSILWCLLLPNSVTNSISPSTSTTAFDKIYEPYSDLMPTTIPRTSQLQHMEFSYFITKKTSNSQLSDASSFKAGDSNKYHVLKIIGLKCHYLGHCWHIHLLILPLNPDNVLYPILHSETSTIVVVARIQEQSCRSW
jgi:hypothetical protein